MTSTWHDIQMSEETKAQTAQLYVVATPIGNLSDASPRMREVLSQVDVIAAEDTRTCQSLLRLLEITAKNLVSYHDHNEKEFAPKLCDRILKENISVALVSDAGTPCVADPGYRLLREAHARGIKVSCVPGTSALAAFLSVSGLRPLPLLFYGFLPNKKSQKLELFSEWQELGSTTTVFYEAPQRIVESLSLLAEIFPKQKICVARELTKFYEEIVHGEAESVSANFAQRTLIKGEFVVGIELEGQEQKQKAHFDQEQVVLELQKAVLECISANMGTKEIQQNFVQAGLSKKFVFDFVAQLKNSLA